MSCHNNIIELIGLEGIIVTNIKKLDEILTIDLQLKLKPQTCPCCCAVTEKIHDYRTQTIMDINHWQLIVRKRRYVCSNCQRRFPEQNDFLSKYQRNTNRLIQKIIYELGDNQTMTKIAQSHGVSANTVMNLTKHISYDKPSTLPRVIGLDEFKGNVGAKYQCILTDPKNRTVLDILPTKNSEDLYDYFISIPITERNKVKLVVIDMSPDFRAIARNCFPKAKIVADKFHFSRLVNQAVDAVRKREAKKRHPQRSLRYKKYKKLPLKHGKNLLPEEKLILDSLLSSMPELEKAYLLKECFFKAINAETFKDSQEQLKRWQEYVYRANIPEFTKVLKSLKSWLKEILAAIKTGYSNGYTEGKNNLVKVFKRISYGLRNFKRFRNRFLYISNTYGARQKEGKKRRPQRKVA